MTRPRTSHDHVWVDLLAQPGARSRADELIDLVELEARARNRRPSAPLSRRSLGYRGLLIAVVMATALRLVTTVDAGANTTTPPPTISVTTVSDRSNPVPLASRTISNDVYVFVTGLPAAATQVRFWIDDPAMASTPSNVERKSPYDLVATMRDGTPNPLRTTGLTDGAHSVSVVVRMSSASDLRFTARFTVANGPASPSQPTLGGAQTTVTTAPPTTTTTAPPTTTTTAAPAPTPAPAASAPPPATGSRLRWAPPELTAPTTIEVGADGGQLNLASDRDYIVRMPQKVSAVGGVTLSGGRNVLLIGGHITIPAGAASNTNDRRGLYLRGQTGTVHVEGLLIDNSGGRLSEGIQINAPQAIVQIQNTRITGIHADDQVGYSDQHPDLIQPWGGARALRIDRFSGSTDYQGLMLKADSNGPLGPTEVSNVNIWPTDPDLSRYLLWQGPDSATFPLAYDNVWLSPASGRSLGKSVWPDTGASNSSKRASTSADGTSVWWPAASQITGVVRSGPPPGGDFVPEGLAGLGYASPGYL